MKNLTQQLAGYAAYHRDPRNIFTHFLGIPMIVLAVAMLLSKPGFSSGGLWFSPALLIGCIACVYYLLLDTRLGLIMAASLALCLWLSALLAQTSTQMWLGWSLLLFIVGWVIQFVGHYFEGRKPAFLDDIMGLAIGPLFVAAELGFLLGLRRPLQQAIEQQLARP